ncbi:LOW QUALITY PROTEIN: hypothetical protein ACHAXS_001318, partial [Conticribra weissflogii]
MWFNPLGIANLISFHHLEKLYNISYSTVGTNKCFIVHTPEGDVKLICDKLGLPFINASKMMSTREGICLMNTICTNYKGYSQRQIQDAEKAREAVAMVGHPTKREFTNMVRLNMIKNCDITPEAITNAFKLFGPDLAGMKGKTVGRKPEKVVTEYVAIPWDLMPLHKYIYIGGDIMFMNNVPHLVTTSQGLNLTTLESRTATQLGECLLCIAQIYSCGGFIVQTFLMDGEFEAVKEKVPGVVINTTAAQEHVGDIERKIWVIKERAQGTLNTLPFQTLPKQILIELIYFHVLWLNAFPVKNGISDCFSPREIVLRQKLDYKKHCKVPFGSYCEVHDEPTLLNSMVARTLPAIALGPTGNFQGTYKFFSLKTERLLKRRAFTPLPMPDSIIAKVNSWGRRAMQPTDKLVFADRNQVPFDWNETVDENTLVEPNIAAFPAMPVEMPGVELEYDLPTLAIDIPDNDVNHATAAAAEANSDINDDPPEAMEIINNEPALIPAEPHKVMPNEDEPDDILAIGDIVPPPNADTVEIEAKAESTNEEMPTEEIPGGQNADAETPGVQQNDDDEDETTGPPVLMPRDNANDSEPSDDESDDDDDELPP